MSRDPFVGGAPPNVVEDEVAEALLVVTPPIVCVSEDAAEVEACPELGIDLDGGGIFLASSSSFRLLLGDSASVGSVSSSVHFLLLLESAFARIGEGGTVLGG